MKNKWIKKGDTVLVISGNDRGKVGEVIAKNQRKILVKGINVRKRHMKSREQNQKSDIISIERPIDISNVALCTSDGTKIKLKVKITEKGTKELVYFKEKNEVNFRTLKNVKLTKD